MIKWKKVAQEIALAAYDDTRNVAITIEMAAKELFNFRPNSYILNGNPPPLFKLIHHNIMTLGEKRGPSDKEKADLLIQFSKVLRLSEEYVLQTLVDAGYVLPNQSSNISETSFTKRNFHPEIVDHCEKFYLQGHYFTAVNEACKAYNIAAKKKLSTQKDGTQLMLAEFGKDKRLRCVPGTTESEENLLEGIKYLSAGLIQGFRNPTSHETHKSWEIGEQDCLDILSLASYLFRRLDESSVY